MSGDPEFENEDFVLVMMAGMFETADDMADLRMTDPLFMAPPDFAVGVAQTDVPIEEEVIGAD